MTNPINQFSSVQLLRATDTPGAAAAAATAEYNDKPYLSVQFSSVQFSSVASSQRHPGAQRSLRRAVGEAETLVLLEGNERFHENVLFSLSKTRFLKPGGVQKAPVGDPSGDRRTEGAQG